MRATLIRSIVAACCLGAWLAGCSAGMMGESLPESMGGLPADTPPPPKVPYQFPAVHDMPPPRATEPLSDKQQWEMEQNLTALRNRQEKETADQSEGDEKPAKTAKTKIANKKAKKKKAKKGPVAGRAGESTGAKTNP